MYFAADYGYDPLGLRRWKIVRPKSVGDRPPWDLVKKSIQQQVVLHLTLRIAGLFGIYHFAEWMGMGFRTAQMPSFVVASLQIFGYVAVSAFLIYFFHYCFHINKTLYKIHKMHHEYRSTNGFATEYNHPLEFIPFVQLPTTLVPVATGAHCYVWFAFIAIRVFLTYSEHSGYAVPFLFPDSTTLHGTLSQSLHHPVAQDNCAHLDAHHSRNVGNYSSSPLWDIVFDTYCTSFSASLPFLLRSPPH